MQGARSENSDEGIRLDSEVPADGFERVRSEKTTFQAGMCMKTKNTVRGPKSEVGGHLPRCSPSGSWLLTPDSCPSRNEGATGDVIENKRAGTRGTGIQDTGRVDSDFCSPWNIGPCGARRACACDGISWERAENKGMPEPNHPSQIAIRQCPGSLLLTSVLQEMKVQPEMLLKTKESVRSPRSEVRSRRASAAGVPIPAPGSLLLTSALEEMKVQPD